MHNTSSLVSNDNLEAIGSHWSFRYLYVVFSNGSKPFESLVILHSAVGIHSDLSAWAIFPYSVRFSMSDGQNWSYNVQAWLEDGSVHLLLED